MEVKVIVMFVTVAFLVGSSASCMRNCQCEEQINELKELLLQGGGGTGGGGTGGGTGGISVGVAVGPSPCADIRRANPAAESGEFTVKDVTGEDLTIFCQFGTLPGCGEGAWQRIVTFNRQGDDASCPRDFLEYEEGGKKCCSNSGPGCVKVEFPVQGQSYTRVCGRVQGYGFNTLDAFRRYGIGNPNDINSPYLDGISITYGFPYKHLWSYAISQSLVKHTDFACPCSGVSTAKPNIPPFVGDNYYCEGRGGVGPNNPLWDGEGCNVEEEAGCCSFPNQPWFHRVIPRTRDPIQLRACQDEGVGNERPAVFQYEFYVQ